MSLIATQVHSLLNEIFPSNPHKRVFSEHYVNFKRQKLFFDFFVPEMNTFVECQGEQHIKFVKHFHGDVSNFKAQKYRDNLKIEYVQEKDMYLIRFYEKEKLTTSLISYKIGEAFDSEFNFFE